MMAVIRMVLVLFIGTCFVCLANCQQTLAVSSNTQSNPEQLAFRGASVPNENSGAQNTDLPSSLMPVGSKMLSAVPPVEANPSYESISPKGTQMNPSTTESMIYLLPFLRSLRKKTSSNQEGQGGEAGQGGEGGTGAEGGRGMKQPGARNEASQEQQKGAAAGQNKFLTTLMNLRQMRNQGINFGQKFSDMLQQRKNLEDSQDKGGAHGAERMISLQDLVNHMNMNRDGMTGNANMLYGQPTSETTMQGGFDGQNSQIQGSQGILLPDGTQGLGGLDMNTLLAMQMQTPLAGEAGNMMLPPSIGDGSQEVSGGLAMGGGMGSPDHHFGGMGVAGQPNDIFGQLLMSQAGSGQMPMDMQPMQALELLTALSMQPGMGEMTQPGIQAGGSLQTQMNNEGAGATYMPMDQLTQGQGQMGDGSMLDMAGMGGLSNVLDTVGMLKALGFGGLKSQVTNQDSMEQPSHMAGIAGEGPSMGNVGVGETGGEGATKGQSGGGEGGAEGSSKRDRKSRMRRLLMLLAIQKQLEANSLSQNSSIMDGSKDYFKFGLIGNNSVGSSNIGLMGASGQSAISSADAQGTAGSYQSYPAQTGRFTRRNFKSQWFSKLTKYFNDKKTQGREEEAGAGEGMKSGIMGMFGRQNGGGEEGTMTGARGMRTELLRLLTSRGAMSNRFGMSAYAKQFMAGGDGEGSENKASGSCRRYPYSLMGNTLIFPFIDGNCKLTVKLNFPDVAIGDTQGIIGTRAKDISQMTPASKGDDEQTNTCPKWRMWRVGKFATYIETVPGRCQIVIYAARSNRRGVKVDQVRVNFMDSLGDRSRGRGDFGQWTREGFKRLMTFQSPSQTQVQSKTQTQAQAQAQAQSEASAFMTTTSEPSESTQPIGTTESSEPQGIRFSPPQIPN